LSGELEELSGRFNLNSLVSTTGTVDADQFLRFERLLVALGFSQYQADQLGGAVVDWIDPDDNQYGQRGASELSSYHQGGANVRVPTNDYILDINELQFIHGFTPTVIQTLLPHVAALPASAKLINVNTASGPVLQAYVEKLTAAQANALVLDRERAFFTSVEDFQQRLPSQAAPATALLKVTSTYFYATGRAHWGDAVTRMQVLLERQQARPDILWIKIQ
jgi:general secretion pathway protein K